MAGLYAVVDAETLARRSIGLREFAEGLREAGVAMVQWRCKVGGPRMVLEGAAVLREVFAGRDCRLVMNDRVDLALLAGFDGVHVGQGDLPLAEAKRLIGFVGVSTHTEAQVEAAEVDGADYVAVGPVFGTQTKLDAEPVVGLAGVRWSRALTGKPLVAIGGITLENCQAVREAGADWVAVISGLLVEGEDVEKIARDFSARLR